MNSASTLTVLLPTILLRLPFLLVCLAGIVIAITQFNAHRKPATLVLVASVMLGLSFAISLGSTVLSIQRVQTDGSPASLAPILGVLGIAQGLLSTAAYGLLIYAAFTGRNPSSVVLPPALSASIND